MAFYAAQISPNLYKTQEGYLVCPSVKIGRTGGIRYLDSELGIGNEGRLITVYRNKEENNNKYTLSSFEGKPITDGHPDVDIDATNYNYYQKGHIQNVKADDNYIYADLFITDEALINEVLSGNKREVSCGYSTVYKEYNGDLYQTNIRGNHLAIVSEGRAGSTVSIRDDANQINKILNRSSKMKDVNQIISDFKRRVADAKTPEEVDAITAEVVDSLELEDEPSLPTQPTQPTQPTTDMEGGNPMEQVMAAISALNAKVDSLVTGKPQSDGSPEGDIDKAIMELESEKPIETSDEDVINEDDKGVTSAKAGEELEDVTSVDNKELEPSFTIEENEQVAKDTALKILRDAKPIIASLKSKEEKRKMADALLKSVKDAMKVKKSSNNDLSKVMDAKNRGTNDTKVSDSKAIENAYMKQNPHMAKKYNLGA